MKNRGQGKVWRDEKLKPQGCLHFEKITGTEIQFMRNRDFTLSGTETLLFQEQKNI